MCSHFCSLEGSLLFRPLNFVGNICSASMRALGHRAMFFYYLKHLFVEALSELF